MKSEKQKSTPFERWVESNFDGYQDDPSVDLYFLRMAWNAGVRYTKNNSKRKEIRYEISNWNQSQYF